MFGATSLSVVRLKLALCTPSNGSCSSVTIKGVVVVSANSICSSIRSKMTKEWPSPSPSPVKPAAVSSSKSSKGPSPCSAARIWSASGVLVATWSRTSLMSWSRLASLITASSAELAVVAIRSFETSVSLAPVKVTTVPSVISKLAACPLSVSTKSPRRSWSPTLSWRREPASSRTEIGAVTDWTVAITGLAIM